MGTFAAISPGGPRRPTGRLVEVPRRARLAFLSANRPHLRRPAAGLRRRALAPRFRFAAPIPEKRFRHAPAVRKVEALPGRRSTAVRCRCRGMLCRTDDAGWRSRRADLPLLRASRRSATAPPPDVSCRRRVNSRAPPASCAQQEQGRRYAAAAVFLLDESAASLSDRSSCAPSSRPSPPTERGRTPDLLRRQSASTSAARSGRRLEEQGHQIARGAGGSVR